MYFIASQFLKRLKKDKSVKTEPIVEKQELTVDEIQPIVIDSIETTDPVDHFVIEVTKEKQIAYDLYMDPTTRQYKAVIIEYDPVTGESEIVKTGDVTRQVALIYENNKVALKKLIKKVK